MHLDPRLYYIGVELQDYVSNEALLVKMGS